LRGDENAIVIHEPGPGGRYGAVLKLEQGPGGYSVHRMTFSGHGGWSYPLESGDLATLARKYVGHVGTDELFELY